MNNSVILILVISLTLANLPWLSDKFFIFFPPYRSTVKRSWMRLLEWLVYGFLMLVFASALEKKMIASLHSQDWEFYAVFFSLFFVFAFPGFVYRHLFLPISHRNSL